MTRYIFQSLVWMRMRVIPRVVRSHPEVFACTVRAGTGITFIRCVIPRSLPVRCGRVRVFGDRPRHRRVISVEHAQRVVDVEIRVIADDVVPRAEMK